MPDRFQELTPYVPPATTGDESTRALALRLSARFSKSRYRQILSLLVEKPRCIFEVAQALSCQEPFTPVHDHQISGRFSAMVDGGLIMHSGLRRPTPSGCQAQEYQVTLTGLTVYQEQSAAGAPTGVPPAPTLSTEIKPPSTPLQTGVER